MERSSQRLHHTLVSACEEAEVEPKRFVSQPGDAEAQGAKCKCERDAPFRWERMVGTEIDIDPRRSEGTKYAKHRTQDPYEPEADSYHAEQRHDKQAGEA